MDSLKKKKRTIISIHATKPTKSIWQNSIPINDKCSQHTGIEGNFLYQIKSIYKYSVCHIILNDEEKWMLCLSDWGEGKDILSHLSYLTQYQKSYLVQ